MSGPKAADVRPKLRRAVEEIEKQVNQAQRTASRLDKMEAVNLNGSIRQADEISRSLEGKNISAAMRKYASEDVVLLNDQRNEIDEQLSRGRREQARAEALQREALQLHNRAESLLTSAVRAAESAARGLANSSNGWYLDREQNQANQARQQAHEALALERQAADKIQQALDHKKNAKNAFDTVRIVGNQFLKKYAGTSKTASEKETAERIAEENQRNAMARSSEIENTLASLKDLRHEKFAPGEMAQLQKSVDDFRASMGRKDFAAASKSGSALASQLKGLEQKVVQLQNAFDAAQQSASNNLKAAREEISVLDQAELAKWTGEDQAVSDAFNAIDNAAALIEAERFSEAESLISANLGKIRDFAKTAEQRSQAANQRMELAEVIMNALYEQGYDSPTFYYSQQKPDGQDIEFSDLTIFAKAPGVRGDMRMNIDLEGKVKLEVEGIAEGEETACHKLIMDLQKGVGDEIDFEMTDWGRAAGVDSNAKLAMRQQEKTQEKVRERQNG